MRQRVLVGFAESLAAIESVWILRDAGYEVHAFTRRGRRPPLGRSLGITVHAVTSPQVDAAACVEEVIALCDRLGAGFAMPLDDDAVWLLDSAHGSVVTHIVGPVDSQARLALDKRLQCAAAAMAGLEVPETMIVDGASREGDMPASCSGWVVKPALAVELRHGRLAKGKGRVVDDVADLEADLTTRTEPVLVQPRLSGVGEGVFGLALGTVVEHVSGHRRVRMMNPAGSGASACVAAEPRPNEVAAVFRMIGTAGWQGLFMIELLRDAQGRGWFMELNGRTWGSMALAARRGLLYPAWAVDAVAGRDVPDVTAVNDSSGSLGWQPPMVRHVGREIVHLAFVARGPRDASQAAEWPSLARSLRAVVRWGRHDRAYNLRRGELPTWFADTVGTVRDQVLPRRSR
jgi:hypothetical protein